MSSLGKFSLAFAVFGLLNPSLFAQTDWNSSPPRGATVTELVPMCKLGYVEVVEPTTTPESTATQGGMAPSPSPTLPLAGRLGTGMTVRAQAPTDEKTDLWRALSASAVPSSNGTRAVTLLVQDPPTTPAATPYPTMTSTKPAVATTILPAANTTSPTDLTTPSIGDCCVPGTFEPQMQSPTLSRDRLGLFADFLYLKSRGTDTIYAQPRDGNTAPAGGATAPLGSQGILESNYSPGLRVGGDFAFSNCSSLEASFTWWQAQTHSFIQAPTTPIGAVLQSTVTLPGIANSAADSQSAGASSTVQFRNADLAYKHLICGDPGCYNVNWLAGVRYAYMKQDFNGDFSILGTTNVDSHITFEGAGPRVGLDGELLGQWGLRLYGRTTANLVAGHFGASYNQANVFAGNQGNIDYKSDRIVPILEAELGFGWVSPNGCIRVTAGYYVSAWFNSVTTPDFINGVQNNNFTTSGGNLSSTQTFDGLTFRVEFRF